MAAHLGNEAERIVDAQAVLALVENAVNATDPGDEVEILACALRGYRGVVLRDKGRYRLVVSITLLRQSVATEIDRDVLAPTALRKVG